MNSEHLKDYPVQMDIAIAWGDMDAFQHVNNVAYFRYFESARIHYSEQLGLHKLKDETGVGPILGATSCKYRLPLTYPDTVTVGAKITDIAQDRFTMKYVVFSHKHQKIAADGDGLVVMYNYREGKKTALPEKIRERIVLMEKMGRLPNGST